MSEETIEGFRIHEWGGELHWESFPRPHPEPGEVLIEVEACGVGLTTLNTIRGDLADDDTSLPLVPGHEFVGRVVACADAVDEPLTGRRIAAYFYLSCGTCRPCLAGWDQRCTNLAGLVGVQRDGGYAPLVTLPARNAIPMPDGIDALTATVVADAVATPVHVCGARAQLTPADRVVVIGAGGGIGSHLVQVARLHGAQVVGVDSNEDKLTTLEQLGIRTAASSELERHSGALFPQGAPTVIIDLAGADATLAWSHDALGVGGRLIVVTTFRDRTFAADPRTLVFREAAIIASRYARRSEVSQAAELVARGDVVPVIGGTETPSDVERLHNQLRQGTLIGRGAIDWSREPTVSR